MDAKTIRVVDATNTQLDWLVAKCEGYAVDFDTYGVMIQRHKVTDRFDPTTNAGWMWPIIEKEKIDCIADPNGRDVWKGRLYRNKAEYYRYGATALIAAARCYVASKLGETVEIPEGLI